MRNFFVWRSALLFIASGVFLVTSCKKSTDVTPTGPVTDKEVNGWILSNMKTYYYWNDKLPVSPDESLTPDVFFKSLLNTYDVATNPNGDRFSWIQESADELKASLNGESKTDGLEYKLYLRTGR